MLVFSEVGPRRRGALASARLAGSVLHQRAARDSQCHRNAQAQRLFRRRWCVLLRQLQRHGRRQLAEDVAHLLVERGEFFAASRAPASSGGLL